MKTNISTLLKFIKYSAYFVLFALIAAYFLEVVTPENSFILYSLAAFLSICLIASAIFRIKYHQELKATSTEQANNSVSKFKLDQFIIAVASLLFGIFLSQGPEWILIIIGVFFSLDQLLMLIIDKVFKKNISITTS